MDLNRREFLKTAGFAGLAGSATVPARARADGPGRNRALDENMGVLVDLTKCNGCRQCEAACQEMAGFEVPTKDELLDESVFLKQRRPGPRSYTTVNRCLDPGENPEQAAVFVKSNCFHCLDPACVSACLVGALRKEPNGAVSYDASKCMGCRYCMVACPFQIPAYEYDNVLTPQVRKCTFCFGEDNPNQGGTPACVKVCPKQCLLYGKRQDLLDQAHNRIRHHPQRYVNHVYGEHEAGGTSWLYLSGVSFERIGFLDVPTVAAARLSEAIQHGVFNYFIPPVAWVGLLGLAMWLTRPERGPRAGVQRAESRPPLQRKEATRAVVAHNR